MFWVLGDALGWDDGCAPCAVDGAVTDDSRQTQVHIIEMLRHQSCRRCEMKENERAEKDD